MPYMIEAEEAVKSIRPEHINELKTTRNPTSIVRLVFDGVLILQHLPIVPTKEETITVSREKIPFIHDCFDEISKSTLLTDVNFLKKLRDFSQFERDNINDETCELLEAYTKNEWFTPVVAANANKAAEGLCKWVGAMV
jgi:dynein heavy chain